MSGQSAALTLKEAREMQMRIQHSGSHASGNGGKKGSGGVTNPCAKPMHQG